MESEAHLEPGEQEHIDEHQRLRAPVVYELIRQKGVEELARPARSLWWSGVAGGLAISTGVYCQAFLHIHLPDAVWRPAVEAFGYCIGFLIVMLGGFQFFTEQTITAVLPLLASRTRRNLVRTGRLWSVVLAANLTGTLTSAALAVFVGLAGSEYLAAFLDISRSYLDKSAAEVFMLAIPAGFLVAALVWMMPSAEGNEFFVIVAVTYMIGLGELTHVVAGSTEAFLLMLSAELSIVATVFGVILPALAGNIIGGTVLFSLLAYAQVKDEF